MTAAFNVARYLVLNKSAALRNMDDLSSRDILSQSGFTAIAPDSWTRQSAGTVWEERRVGICIGPSVSSTNPSPPGLEKMLASSPSMALSTRSGVSVSNVHTACLWLEAFQTQNRKDSVAACGHAADLVEFVQLTCGESAASRRYQSSRLSRSECTVRAGIFCSVYRTLHAVPSIHEQGQKSLGSVCIHDSPSALLLCVVCVRVPISLILSHNLHPLLTLRSLDPGG